MRPSWTDEAACLGMNPDPWFSDDARSVAYAKSVCQGCRVRAVCLADALDRNEHHGTLGGLSADERRRVRRKRLKMARRAS